MEIVTKKRMQIFSGRAYRELAQEVVDHLGMRLGDGASQRPARRTSLPQMPIRSPRRFPRGPIPAPRRVVVHPHRLEFRGPAEGRVLAERGELDREADPATRGA